MPLTDHSQAYDKSLWQCQLQFRLFSHSQLSIVLAKRRDGPCAKSERGAGACTAFWWCRQLSPLPRPVPQLQTAHASVNTSVHANNMGHQWHALQCDRPGSRRITVADWPGLPHAAANGMIRLAVAVDLDHSASSQCGQRMFVYHMQNVVLSVCGISRSVSSQLSFVPLRN